MPSIVGTVTALYAIPVLEMQTKRAQTVVLKQGSNFKLHWDWDSQQSCPEEFMHAGLVKDVSMISPPGVICRGDVV